jgi:hypothetical protein
MEIAMNNAMILYNSVNTKQFRNLDFRKSVIESLINGWRIKKYIPTSAPRTKIKMIYKVETEFDDCLLRKNIKIGDCAIHKAQGERKQIKWYCTICNDYCCTFPCYDQHRKIRFYDRIRTNTNI